MYKFIFKHVFSKMDPEQAHHLVFTGLKVAGNVPILSSIVQGALAPYLTQGPGVEVFGRRVPAPFGLAGGFDKNAESIRGLTMLGFGFVEVGTVTAQAQPGNEKPRMWREIELEGLRNRMGFNNEGAEAAAQRLAKLRATKAGRAMFVGANIGKTKVTPAEQAFADYAHSAALMAPLADYLVVNVSSPNTPGLRDLQNVDSLRPILKAVREAADNATDGAGRPRIPLLVKIAPDHAEALVLIERPKQASHGDYASNLAMQLARAMKANPRQIAENLLQNLPASTWLIKADIAGAGFINFTLATAAKTQVVKLVLLC